MSDKPTIHVANYIGARAIRLYTPGAELTVKGEPGSTAEDVVVQLRELGLRIEVLDHKPSL